MYEYTWPNSYYEGQSEHSHHLSPQVDEKHAPLYGILQPSKYNNEIPGDVCLVNGASSPQYHHSHYTQSDFLPVNNSPDNLKPLSRNTRNTCSWTQWSSPNVQPATIPTQHNGDPSNTTHAHTITTPLLHSSDHCSTQFTRAFRTRPRCFEHGCAGRSFSSLGNYMRHMREQTGKDHVRCHFCRVKFGRKSNRDTHIARGKCKVLRRTLYEQTTSLHSESDVAE